MVSGKKRAQRSTDRWRFYRDGANKWRWKYVMQGKTAARAYSGFEQYSDCVQDARRHGYRENVK